MRGGINSACCVGIAAGGKDGSWWEKKKEREVVSLIKKFYMRTIQKDFTSLHFTSLAGIHQHILTHLNPGRYHGASKSN